jgi:hypothetical protein
VDVHEMNTLTWRITGRSSTGFSSDDGPPENWREQLAIRLGHRPRRIGILAELALFGALDCLDAARETDIPLDVVLQVCSSRGSISTITQVLEQNRDGLPMPFSFLQSQTSQILPALAAALNWQGDAGVVLARSPMDFVMLACRQAGGAGMLLGWVEEGIPGRSAWLRLVPCIAPTSGFGVASGFAELVMPNTHYWRLRQGLMEIATAVD